MNSRWRWNWSKALSKSQISHWQTMFLIVIQLKYCLYHLHLASFHLNVNPLVRNMFLFQYCRRSCLQLISEHAQRSSMFPHGCKKEVGIGITESKAGHLRWDTWSWGEIGQWDEIHGTWGEIGQRGMKTQCPLEISTQDMREAGQ